MMRELSRDEVKAIELQLLKEIDSICEKYNLSYNLCGGSLIGAVRHKGFIPWDDDIDINMPRPDYEKLKTLLCSDNISFFTTEDKGYYYGFGKIVDNNTYLDETSILNSYKKMGVYLDVFPLDGLPNNSIKRIIHFIRLRKVYYQLFLLQIDGPQKRKNFILVMIQHLLWINPKKYGEAWVKDKYVKLVNQYSFCQSEYVCSGFGLYGFKEIIPKSYISDFFKGEFEGYSVNIPKQYDSFLTRMYGDYLELPPVEQRKPKHLFNAYEKK